MVIKLADNIYSPLGVTSQLNFQAVMENRCAMQRFQLPDGSPYMASLFPEAERFDDSFTFFERLCILSASDAIARAGIDAASPKVRFFFSTTKANVHLLDSRNRGRFADDRVLPGVAAAMITRYFGNDNLPVVVSNACISGLSAQIAAMRSLEAGLCDYAVVVGCDIQSEFIISGFQTLHALSPDPCRPFDSDRCGLNLGEAAATIVYASSDSCSQLLEAPWCVMAGTMCNDANHISGPSRTGEGSFRCLQALGFNPEDLAFVSIHGTSTLYNDEMESIALSRAGLSEVPMFSLKGIFGHTMGAAGLLETILSMQAVERGVIFGTKGFQNLGVSCQVSISSTPRTTDKHAFVKLMSGFGGCNAAMLFSLHDNIQAATPTLPSHASDRLHSICIDSMGTVDVDGVTESCQAAGCELLSDLYRSRVGDYPKFFKMDPLSRLGFVASELLLKVAPRRNYGVLLFNRTSSLADDTAFQATIDDKANFFPSPALFVYTLPNIVTGEIAIRNNFQTETSFIVLPTFDSTVMADQIALSAQQEPMLAGWVDCWDKERFRAMMLAIPQGTSAAEIAQCLQQMNDRSTLKHQS